MKSAAVDESSMAEAAGLANPLLLPAVAEERHEDKRATVRLCFMMMLILILEPQWGDWSRCRFGKRMSIEMWFVVLPCSTIHASKVLVALIRFSFMYGKRRPVLVSLGSIFLRDSLFDTTKRTHVCRGRRQKRPDIDSWDINTNQVHYKKLNS